jgi:hypothetical protein
VENYLFRRLKMFYLNHLILVVPCSFLDRKSVAFLFGDQLTLAWLETMVLGHST